MVLLKISLLGPFQAWLGGKPVTNFESNKVKALLSYLAVEKDRPHTREMIAGLLWPDYPEHSALANLRWALSSLRASIEDRSSKEESAFPPHIITCRETIQFNIASDYWLDVAEFKEISGKEIFNNGLASPNVIDRLLGAVGLYHGSFLEGFSLPDSASFEDWMLLQREHFGRINLINLSLLADYYEECGDYESAQQFVWRLIEIEPWHEEAHQQLMRLLAMSGRRSEAINRYEKCRKLLREGLGVEPSKDTRLLYERIRDGLPVKKLPKLGRARLQIEDDPKPVFVGRENEMLRLMQVLDQVLAGSGQVFFIVGEAGIGKTALAWEFVRRSLMHHKNLIAIFGSCNTQPDIGIPYLPFIEAFHLLAGEFQPWMAGAISKEHVRRLGAVLPDVINTILEVGPGLLENFLSESALVAYSTSSPDNQRVALSNQIKHAVRKRKGLQQVGLFEQYLHVLQRLAHDHPILLVIDDLQWVDAGSLGLLFYLGRRLAGSRILIIGAYRQNELLYGRRGKRNPLESVINEFQEQYGDISLDLMQSSSRRFNDALVEIHPNQLGEDFRQALYNQTGGNPLFTLELLRHMADCGGLTLDHAGRWIQGEPLDHESLPPRVEAVIAERIHKLAAQDQALLLAASVQGESFIAEVLASLLDISTQKILESLSEVVCAQHHLVDPLSARGSDGRYMTRYHFHHSVIQKYLYDSISPLRRVWLHQTTGEALEVMCFAHKAGRRGLEPGAASLAWHFEQAGLYEKAVDYLLLAGREAFSLSSNEQAIAFYRRGIGLIARMPESQDLSRRELPLQIALQAALQSEVGIAGSEVGQACARSVELAYHAGDPADICASLLSLITYYLYKAEYRRVSELSSQLDSLAETYQESGAMTYARLAKGLLSIFLGDFFTARQHLEFVIAGPPTSRVEELLSPLFQDIRLIARIFLGLPLWFLGYPDTAIQKGDEAIHLANDLGHLQSQGLALGIAGGMISLLRQDGYKIREFAESLYLLTKGNKLQSINRLSSIFLGKYLIDQGQLQEGLSTLHDGWVACQRQGVNCMSTVFLAMMAEACSDPRDGLRMVEDALALARDNGERLYLAELYRIRGELLVARAGVGLEAETSIRRALYISRMQKARSLELRAATSLARLYMQQNQIENAYRRLEDILDQFTEGFDTHDLRQARELLEELACTAPAGITA